MISSNAIATQSMVYLSLYKAVYRLDLEAGVHDEEPFGIVLCQPVVCLLDPVMKRYIFFFYPVHLGRCGPASQAFFNGREEVFGNGAADNSFCKLKFFALARFKFNKYIAELTVSAALLFMSALCT